MRGRSFAGMPAPVSETRTQTHSPAGISGKGRAPLSVKVMRVTSKLRSPPDGIASRALSLLKDGRQALMRLGRKTGGCEHHFGVEDHRGHDVVEIVSDACRQLPDGGAPFLFLNLLLGLADVGDVAD